MPADVILPGGCAALYVALSILIAWRYRRPAPFFMAVCCLITAVWAASLTGVELDQATRLSAATDLVRAASWFCFVFFLYHRARLGRAAAKTVFALGAAAGVLVAAVAIGTQPGPVMTDPLIVSMAAGRLALAIILLLLIENLYFNLHEDERWHVALPAVLLGALACFDIVQCAGMAVYHVASAAIDGTRLVAMIMVAPLLVVAAVRGNRWKFRVRLSRTAVFHSATMLLSGGVLLALGVAGELSRRLEPSLGWVAEASLGFAGLVAIGLMLTSGSARSRLQRIFVDHFFAERYDYRGQWLSCIRTLSGEEGDQQMALGIRAVRAMANVVDSPAGAMFLRDGAAGPFVWAGSWNVPAVDAIPPDHPAVLALRDGAWIAELNGPHAELSTAPLDGLGPLLLAVPLMHRAEVTGIVFLAPSRAPFPLEREVFNLLRIVAQEISTYIAEQRATQTLLQARQLHEYSKRFAFVAHDIKNVSSQLALLSVNAKNHMANPEFQKDLLDTVDASVRKITALLQRLERPEVDRAPAAAAPLTRLEALAATYRRVRQADLVLEHDGSTGTVAMGMDQLETAATHLLNNAVEASNGTPVVLRVRHEVRQVVVEIADEGPGMTAEFVRDRLFRPFSTSKKGGSGIGAYQAREMVREAGGDLIALSEPGLGTTMRILLPRTDAPGGADRPRTLVRSGI